jgi:ABC-type transport system involved in cytochrome c biogenesis permease subunit
LADLSGSEVDENADDDDDTQLHIPVVMVLLVLLCYCAIGGLLFCNWEGWDYFEAFYFCFITMATVGWSREKITKIFELFEIIENIFGNLEMNRQ